MRKITFTLKQNGHFCQNPGLVEIDPENVYLNDVVLPREIDPDGGYNPHGVGLWVIGHEFGAICAVWGANEQEVLDNACDLNALDSLLAEDQDYDNQDLTPLGNASELFDLTTAWIGRVEWDAARDIKTIVSIVRYSENQKDTLGD